MAYEPGQVIMKSTAFAHILNKKAQSMFCDNCVSLASLKTCTGCHLVKYCSKECQAKGWEEFHKKECKFLRGGVPETGNPDIDQIIRLFARAVIKLGNDGNEVFDEMPAPDGRKVYFKDLISHFENLSRIGKAVTCPVRPYIEIILPVKLMPYFDFICRDLNSTYVYRVT